MRASKVITQIYEIQDPWEAEAVSALGVDRIGSVLMTAQEWKIPQIKEAVDISKRAGRKHSIIPLFDDMEILFRVVDYYKPHLIHFCDTLPGRPDVWESQVQKQLRVKARYPEIMVMRSIPICPAGSWEETSIFDVAGRFEPVSDYLLIDTWMGNQPDVPYIGITGCTCNWDIAGQLVRTSSVPVILAGGLSPENVYHAIDKVRPFGVDSCTLTNARDEEGNVIRFKKDLNRVRSFIEEVERAERDFPYEHVVRKAPQKGSGRDQPRPK